MYQLQADVAAVIRNVKSGFQDCNSKLKLFVLIVVTLCSVGAGVDQGTVQ